MGSDVSCGVRFLRGVLLLANILFIILGLILVGIGIYIKVSDNFTSILDQFEIDGFNGQSLGFLAFVMIGGGAFTLLLALFGCAGTLWNSRCVLYTYAFILFVLMVVELVGFILAFVYRNKLEDTYKDGLDKVLQKGLKENNTRIIGVFATLQTQVKCCGATNITDYTKNNRSDLAAWCKENHVEDIGCSQKIIDTLDANLPAVGGTLGAVLGIEFFGLLFAVILAVALRHADGEEFSSSPGEVFRQAVPGRRHNY